MELTGRKDGQLSLWQEEVLLKEAIFLSPAHAAAVLAGPAVSGAAGGASGAGEGKRLKGALIGIPAGYAGTVAGLASGLDPTGVPSAILGGGGAGYLAGRTLRGGKKKPTRQGGKLLKEARMLQPGDLAQYMRDQDVARAAERRVAQAASRAKVAKGALTGAKLLALGGATYAGIQHGRSKSREMKKEEQAGMAKNASAGAWTATGAAVGALLIGSKMHKDTLQLPGGKSRGVIEHESSLYKAKSLRDQGAFTSRGQLRSAKRKEDSLQRRLNAYRESVGKRGPVIAGAVAGGIAGGIAGKRAFTKLSPYTPLVRTRLKALL